MNRFKIVLPTMILVLFLSMWVLEKDYSTVPLQIRILIAAGGALLSGVITYILIKQDVNRIDKKPNN
jgi:hypothetical protein